MNSIETKRKNKALTKNFIYDLYKTYERAYYGTSNVKTRAVLKVQKVTRISRATIYKILKEVRENGDLPSTVQERQRKWPNGITDKTAVAIEDRVLSLSALKNGYVSLCYIHGDLIKARLFHGSKGSLYTLLRQLGFFYRKCGDRWKLKFTKKTPTDEQINLNQSEFANFSTSNMMEVKHSPVAQMEFRPTRNGMAEDEEDDLEKLFDKGVGNSLPPQSDECATKAPIINGIKKHQEVIKSTENVDGDDVTKNHVNRNDKADSENKVNCMDANDKASEAENLEAKKENEEAEGSNTDLDLFELDLDEDCTVKVENGEITDASKVRDTGDDLDTLLSKINDLVEDCMEPKSEESAAVVAIDACIDEIVEIPDDDTDGVIAQPSAKPTSLEKGKTKAEISIDIQSEVKAVEKAETTDKMKPATAEENKAVVAGQAEMMDIDDDDVVCLDSPITDADKEHDDQLLVVEALRRVFETIDKEQKMELECDELPQTEKELVKDEEMIEKSAKHAEKLITDDSKTIEEDEIFLIEDDDDDDDDDNDNDDDNDDDDESMKEVGSPGDKVETLEESETQIEKRIEMLVENQLKKDFKSAKENQKMETSEEKAAAIDSDKDDDDDIVCLDDSIEEIEENEDRDEKDEIKKEGTVNIIGEDERKEGEDTEKAVESVSVKVEENITEKADKKNLDKEPETEIVKQVEMKVVEKVVEKVSKKVDVSDENKTESKDTVIDNNEELKDGLEQSSKAITNDEIVILDDDDEDEVTSLATIEKIGQNSSTAEAQKISPKSPIAEENKIEEKKIEENQLEENEIQEEKIEGKKVVIEKVDKDNVEEEKVGEDKVEKKEVEEEKVEEKKVDEEQVEEVEENKIEEGKTEEIKAESSRAEESKSEESKSEENKTEVSKPEESKSEESKTTENKIEEKSSKGEADITKPSTILSDNSDNARDAVEEKEETNDAKASKQKTSVPSESNSCSNSNSLLKETAKEERDENSEQPPAKRIRLSQDEANSLHSTVSQEDTVSNTVDEDEVMVVNVNDDDESKSLKRVHSTESVSSDFKKPKTDEPSVKVDNVEPEIIKKKVEVKPLPLYPPPKLEVPMIDLSLDFLRRFKKSVHKMTKGDLEELVLQKIVEAIVHKSEFSEMRDLIEKQEKIICGHRTKIAELNKQFRDLEMVHNRVLKDLETKNAQFIMPVKITRAVGLQVFFPNKKYDQPLVPPSIPMQSLPAPTSRNMANVSNSVSERSIFSSPAATSGNATTPTANNSSQATVASNPQQQTTVQRRGCLQKLTPMRPDTPHNSPLNRSLGTSTVSSTTPVAVKDVSPNMKILNRTLAQKNRLSSPSLIANLITNSPTPIASQPAALLPVSVEKPTATAIPPGIATKKTAMVQSLGMFKHNKRFPKSCQSDPQSVAQPLPASATVVSSQIPPNSTTNVAVTFKPPSKSVIDLTDEDDIAAPNVPRPATEMAVPSTSSVNQPAIRRPYKVSVIPQQQLQQQPKPNPPKQTPTRPLGKIPIAPKPNGTTVAVRQIPSNPARYRHPAPLPNQPIQSSNPSWKLPPARPTIRISNLESGIVISWTIEDTSKEKYAESTSYQIYAYQETSGPPLVESWRHVGDVKAMLLPMAVTLTQFQEGQRYYFAVRAVDAYNRCGPFSFAKTWS